MTYIKEEQKKEIQTLYNPRKSKLIQPLPIKPDNEITTRGYVYIYYATTSGNSCQLAFDLQNDARQQGFFPCVIDLGNFNADQLIQIKLGIFCISTYGHGGPPRDAEEFNNWLHNQEDDQIGNILKNLNYTVFGLGSSQYEQFCQMAIYTDNRLEELGAQRIYKLGKGDANNDMTQQNFNNWKQNLWESLKEKFPEKTMKESELQKQGVQYTIQRNKGVQELNFLSLDEEILKNQNLEKSIQNYINSAILPVMQMKELRKVPEETSCIFVDLNVANTSCESYQTAGNIAIYPENDKETVEEFANIIGLNLDTVFTLIPKNKQIKLPIPSPISVRTFLTKFCDLLGPISKNQLYILSQYIQDERDKQNLEQLCTYDAIQEYTKKIVEKKHSLYSIIFSYSIQISLEVLISISQRILPRYYTISSSNLLFPQNIHLTISIHQINSPQRLGLGLMSQYIKQGMNIENFTMRGFLSKSCFVLPQNSKTNIIMMANGAGLAPFRAFIQEKFYYQINNIKNKIGQMILFFGCRAKNIDYIYQKELEKMLKDKVLNKLFVAFSRESSVKVYVQDLLEQNKEMVGKKLFKESGKLYICGSSAMGDGINKVLEELIQKTNGVQAYQAYGEIEKLIQNKQIIKEVW